MGGDREADAVAPTGAELGRGWFEHSPFVGLLGMRLVDVRPDEVRVELPLRADLTTAGDIVHGGAISALVDTSAALAAWSGHDPDCGSARQLPPRLRAALTVPRAR